MTAISYCSSGSTKHLTGGRWAKLAIPEKAHWKSVSRKIARNLLRDIYLLVPLFQQFCALVFGHDLAVVIVSAGHGPASQGQRAEQRLECRHCYERIGCEFSDHEYWQGTRVVFIIARGLANAVTASCSQRILGAGCR